jgi:hypothetical protein
MRFHHKTCAFLIAAVATASVANCVAKKWVPLTNEGHGAYRIATTSVKSRDEATRWDSCRSPLFRYHQKYWCIAHNVSVTGPYAIAGGG